MARVNNSQDVRYYEIGIVSWGIGCGSVKGIPAVYTRISKYVSWIQQITADDPCAPFASLPVS